MFHHHIVVVIFVGAAIFGAGYAVRSLQPQAKPLPFHRIGVTGDRPLPGPVYPISPKR